MNAPLRVVDSGSPLEFTIADMLRFHLGNSPGGVAIAFKALERALPLLAPDGLVERRSLVIRTAFGGPGARDGFESVTGAVSDGRYTVDPALSRPELGRTREHFVFMLTYRDRSVTLVLEPGFVTDEFVTLAGTDPRTPPQEQRLTRLKADLAERVMAAQATAVFAAGDEGGVVFGQIGDRSGRRRALVLTLLITIGLLGPILLVTLRFVQGIGLGGEWGGAVLMAIEHGDADRRGLFGSVPQLGVPLGNLLRPLVESERVR